MRTNDEQRAKKRAIYWFFQIKKDLRAVNVPTETVHELVSHFTKMPKTRVQQLIKDAWRDEQLCTETANMVL